MHHFSLTLPTRSLFDDPWQMGHRQHRMCLGRQALSPQLV